MDNEASLPVAIRWWWDRSEGTFMGGLWTVTDNWNTVISLAIGILFGLVQPSIERIVAHLLAYICYKVPKSSRTEDEAEDDNTPLLGNSSGKTRRCCTRANAAWVVSLIAVVAFIIAGTFVTKFSVEGPALSASKRCGVWGLRDDANSAAQDEDALIQGEREARAGQYARDCYGPHASARLNRCSIFKHPRIKTTEIKLNQECPFIDENYCPGDSYSAVKFTTGLVDAKRIGVNRNHAPKFNRTTVCVPLNLDAGFVHHLLNRGEWGYDLGPVNGSRHKSKYTFEQPSDPWDYDVRSYTMSTYVHVYGKAAEDNYWQPSPALNIQPGLNVKSEPYSITLMFINSCHFYYEESSDDWVFPAQELWNHTALYWNYDSRARPLACIDWIEICRNSTHCAPPHLDDEDADRTYEFTRFALNKSSAFHAIEFRGASGLDAQYKIQDDTSLPLSRDPPQWIVESWRLFNTSLARIQYDAFDIANGTNGDDIALYTQKMPKRVHGKMCGMFAFQPPKGYMNIRLVPMFLFGIVLPFLLWLMALETKVEFSDDKKRSGWFHDMKLILIEKSMVAELKKKHATGQNHHQAADPTQQAGNNYTVGTLGWNRP